LNGGRDSPGKTLEGNTMNSISRILVLGGTGFVGRALCERLCRRSGGSAGRIVVPTRRLPRGDAVRSLPTVEVVAADLHDDTTLATLLAGMDAVVNLVAILQGSPAAFDKAHVQLPTRLARLTKAAGVPRLVHVSALGVSDKAPSHYLRSKAAGEATLKAGYGTPTILRPSVIFGAGDRFLNLFAMLQGLAPVLPLAGASARMQPVWVEDVAAAVVHALDTPGTAGQTVECAGPAEYTLSQLVRLAGRWAGHERPQIPLPGFVATLQAVAMELMPGEPLLSRDNLASLSVPNVASGTLPGLADWGITPTPLEAVMPQHLGRDSARGLYDSFRAHVRRH
jgi:NADH dehydrogenase